MKKLLLGTTALISAAAIVGTANAQCGSSNLRVAKSCVDNLINDLGANAFAAKVGCVAVRKGLQQRRFSCGQFQIHKIL